MTREVYTNDEIPHRWAHNLDKGRYIRNSRGTMFAKHQEIYSYGEHFPMAKRTQTAYGLAFLVNPASYSITTTQHQHSVRMAIPVSQEWVFHVPPTVRDSRGLTTNLWAIIDGTGKGSSTLVADWFQGQVDAAAKAACRPRIRAATRQAHLDHAAKLVREWRALHAFYRLRCSIDRVTTPVSLEDCQRIHAKALAKHKAEQAAQKKADKARAEEYARQEAARLDRVRAPLAAMVARWRFGAGKACANVSGPGEQDVYSIRDYGCVLRFAESDGEQVVETSMGARIPVAEAVAFIASLETLARKAERREGTVVDSEAVLGGYRGIQVNRYALKIGCHTIHWTEVRAFVAHALDTRPKEEGWTRPVLPANWGEDDPGHVRYVGPASLWEPRDLDVTA